MYIVSLQWNNYNRLMNKLTFKILGMYD